MGLGCFLEGGQISLFLVPIRQSKRLVVGAVLIDRLIVPTPLVGFSYYYYYFVIGYLD